MGTLGLGLGTLGDNRPKFRASIQKPHCGFRGGPKTGFRVSGALDLIHCVKNDTHQSTILQYYNVLLRITLYYKVLLQYYNALLRTTTYYAILPCTTKYYSHTTLYYKVLLQYHSVLRSTTPLICTAKYYSSTTTYYSVLQSTTPVLLCITKYYSVLQRTYVVARTSIHFVLRRPVFVVYILCITD